MIKAAHQAARVAAVAAERWSWSEQRRLDMGVAEAENREENNRQQNQPDPEADALPELLTISMHRTIAMIKLTNGMNIRITHQRGRPATLHTK
jgi:hypothetical protein